jgi:hypothetical protein
VRLADEFVDEVEAGSPHYMEGAVRLVRALTALARGDEAGALAESERMMVVGRGAQDPQVLIPSLAFHAFVLSETDRLDDAVPLVDELLARLRSGRRGFVSFWALPFTVVLGALGRTDDLAVLVESAAMSTRWLDVARAFAAGDLLEAADMSADMGAIPDEAFIRLRAGEALVKEGRRAQADAQLQRALAFYRSVGATAYIREAEELFAASA